MLDKGRKKLLAEVAQEQGDCLTSCGCWWVLWIVAIILVFGCPIIGIPIAILLFTMEKKRRQWVKDKIKDAENDTDVDG